MSALHPGTPLAADADSGRCVADNGQPHLLLCGWYRPGTGFTRVLLALLPYLRAQYRITWLGVGYQGPPLDLHDHVRLLPTNLRGGDMVGAYAADQHWARWSPDVVLALNDPWYLEHYSRALEHRAGAAPLVGYLPLDGAIDDPAVLRHVTGFHTLVTYTHWAAAQLGSALRHLGIDSRVAVAGHGVELQQFRPLPGAEVLAVRMQRAQQMFGLAEPAFVVLNASRPDPRKRLDLTLEAFAAFARDLPPTVRLCLHQAFVHEDFVAPLRVQAEALGIAQRLLWFPRTPGPLDDAGLNALYNACAVGLNTAQGEGFGLVSFEHAATGAPQVLPAHPALVELWGGDAALAAPVRPIRSPWSPLQMGEVAIAGVAAALRQLYTDPGHYARLAAAGRARCTDPGRSWSGPAQSLLAELQLARNALREEAFLATAS